MDAAERQSFALQEQDDPQYQSGPEGLPETVGQRHHAGLSRHFIDGKNRSIHDRARDEQQISSRWRSFFKAHVCKEPARLTSLYSTHASTALSIFLKAQPRLKSTNPFF
jgi:hypothetical protein